MDLFQDISVARFIDFESRIAMWADDFVHKNSKVSE